MLRPEMKFKKGKKKVQLSLLRRISVIKINYLESGCFRQIPVLITDALFKQMYINICGGGEHKLNICCYKMQGKEDWIYLICNCILLFVVFG